MTGEANSDLRRRLAALPRLSLLNRPTPLQELPRFSAALKGPRILIKREDLSGLALGGNKTRELEYFIGAALADGADVFIAGGGVAQSNHAVQCSAAARRAGIRPVMVLHDFRSDDVQGNHLLTRLLGADLRFVPSPTGAGSGADRNALGAAMEEVAAEYRSRGDRVFVLRSSFHPLGAVGFVDCALELEEQLVSIGVEPTSVYLTSAGATQVGLVVGSRFLGSGYKVTGIAPTATDEGLESRMADLANQTAELLELPARFTPDDICNESHAGPGYGLVSEEGVAAIQLLAETEGLFLDPVYSAKGMAGLIDHIRTGRLQASDTVVFVHTGGLPALFAYSEELAAALPGARPR